MFVASVVAQWLLAKRSWIQLAGAGPSLSGLCMFSTFLLRLLFWVLRSSPPSKHVLYIRSVLGGVKCREPVSLHCTLYVINKDYSSSYDDQVSEEASYKNR